MPSVLKSHQRQDTGGDLEFIEWSYRGWRPSVGQAIAWFTPETSGGMGLFALGEVTRTATDAGKNAKGNDLVRFFACFNRFNPSIPLRKEHFRALPRIGAGSPLQRLNRCLYINSHVKVAEIDDETLAFIANRF